MTAVLRPPPEAVARFRHAGLDVVRFEADAEAVVAYDGHGRAHRFARDGSDTAPVAIALIDDGDYKPAKSSKVHVALLDSSGRALAWHSSSLMWDLGEVEPFARAAGLRFMSVDGLLREAPGGHSLDGAPGDWVLPVLLLVSLLAVLVLGTLNGVSRLAILPVGYAVVVAVCLGHRYLMPVRKRVTDQDGIRPPSDGPPSDGPAAG